MRAFRSLTGSGYAKQVRVFGPVFVMLSVLYEQISYDLVWSMILDKA